MATVLELRRGSDVLGLYDDSNGVRARAGGWRQGRANQGPDGTWEAVDEIIKLKIAGQGSTENTMAAKLHELDLVLRRANEWSNRAHGGLDRVWLHAQSANEPDPRRSIVLNGSTRHNQGMLSKLVDQADTMLDMDLVLTRHPFWELAEESEHDWALYLDSVGGMIKFERNIYGDVPARISDLRVRPHTTHNSSVPLFEFWIGFRSHYLGDPSLFLPNWDLGDADNDYGDNTSRVTGESYVHGGQVARFTPADTVFEDRVTVEMGNVTSNIAHQNGTFLVLLRAKATSNSTFRVRMLSGYYDQEPGGASYTKWKTGTKVAIPAHDWSNYYYYPMGFVNIPGERIVTPNSLLKHFAFRLEAEEYGSGTGYLDMDCLTLIPISEGGIHLKDTRLYNWSGTATAATVTTEADDSTMAYNVVDSGSGTDGTRDIQHDLYHWGCPVGIENYMIGACQRVQSQAYLDTFRVDFRYYQRFLSAVSYFQNEY